MQISISHFLFLVSKFCSAVVFSILTPLSICIFHCILHFFFMLVSIISEFAILLPLTSEFSFLNFIKLLLQLVSFFFLILLHLFDILIEVVLTFTVLCIEQVCLLLHPLLHSSFTFHNFLLAFSVTFLFLLFKMTHHPLFPLQFCLVRL